MAATDRIEIDPRVMMATEADLFDAYPRLTREDIRAAIGYAADTLACEETVILTPRETV